MRRRYSIRSETEQSLRPCSAQNVDEIGHAGHRPVGLHDLADHACRPHAGEPREVDGGLGLAGALEHAARAGAQREDVTGLDDVARAGGRRARHLDGVGAILGRDAGLDALAGLDRDRERGLVRRLVVLHHHLQPELLAALGRQREADQPTAVRGHEVDRVGVDVLRRHAQIALVLAVGRVDDHDHATRPDLLDRLLDAAEGRRHFAHAVPRSDRGRSPWGLHCGEAISGVLARPPAGAPRSARSCRPRGSRDRPPRASRTSSPGACAARSRRRSRRRAAPRPSGSRPRP